MAFEKYQHRRVAGVSGDDIVFDDFHFSLEQQMKLVDNLQKAVVNYKNSMRGAKESMKELNSCLSDFYEDIWPKHREFNVAIKDMNTVWDILNRYTHELEEPIRRYRQQGVDTLKCLKSHDLKLTDGRFGNKNSQSITSDVRRNKIGNVNAEMVGDMTSLFKRRGDFAVDIFKSVFTAHDDFFSECAKITSAILDMVNGLDMAKLEMSVGQGGNRRVISINAPRIGWAKTTPQKTQQQDSSPTSAFVPKPNRSQSLPAEGMKHGIKDIQKKKPVFSRSSELQDQKSLSNKNADFSSTARGLQSGHSQQKHVSDMKDDGSGTAINESFNKSLSQFTKPARRSSNAHKHKMLVDKQGLKPKVELRGFEKGPQAMNRPKSSAFTKNNQNAKLLSPTPISQPPIGGKAVYPSSKHQTGPTKDIFNKMGAFQKIEEDKKDTTQSGFGTIIKDENTGRVFI